MIKNDEDYLIKRTYTNYGGRKMCADEMFEELGYEKQNNPEKEIKYIKNEFHIIRFWKPSQQIIKQDEQGLYMGITMQELQAINKKVEELGWNE